jgi:hypothetical protein
MVGIYVNGGCFCRLLMAGGHPEPEGLHDRVKGVDVSCFSRTSPGVDRRSLALVTTPSACHCLPFRQEFHDPRKRHSAVWHWEAAPAGTCQSTLVTDPFPSAYFVQRRLEIFSFSGPSTTHDSSCKIFLVRSWHILSFRSSACNFDIGNRSRKRPGRPSGWLGLRSCCCTRCSYRCSCCKSGSRRRGGGDWRHCRAGCHRYCTGSN